MSAFVPTPLHQSSSPSSVRSSIICPLVYPRNVLTSLPSTTFIPRSRCTPHRLAPHTLLPPTCQQKSPYEDAPDSTSMAPPPKQPTSTRDVNLDDNIFDAASFERGEELKKAFRELTLAETALCYANPTASKMSHEVVRFDSDGLGPRDRYVYVEERDCIGCSHCQTTAMNTFFLEDEHGRARVFDQTGDGEKVVEEAIDTCPVNCIYYVSWDDLVTLELERREQEINNWARLVGGQDVSSSKQFKRRTTVMDSSIMRCDNCPNKGCPQCPMYGVGENPEYKRRQKIRAAKKTARKQKQRSKRRQL